MARLAALVLGCLAPGTLLLAGAAGATALHSFTDVRISINGLNIEEDPQNGQSPSNQSQAMNDLSGIGWGTAHSRVYPALFEPDVETSAKVEVTTGTSDTLAARAFAELTQKYSIQSTLPRSSVNLRLTILPRFSLGMTRSASGFTGISWDLAETDQGGNPIRFLASQICTQNGGSAPGCGGSPNVDSSGFSITMNGDNYDLGGSLAITFTGMVGERFYQIGTSSDASLSAPSAGFFAQAGIGNFFSFSLSSPDPDVTVTPFLVPEPGTGALAAAGLALLALGRRHRT